MIVINENESHLGRGANRPLPRSCINALEVHGLDICRDHGIDGFKRYVALAVVGRNLHRLGAILLEQEAEQERRRRKRAA